jgi:hypothetical protein
VWSPTGFSTAIATYLFCMYVMTRASSKQERQEADHAERPRVPPRGAPSRGWHKPRRLLQLLIHEAPVLLPCIALRLAGASARADSERCR